nr:hypothetical protein GCM10017611_07380 [Rhodococcus wratislaviensis]
MLLLALTGCAGQDRLQPEGADASSPVATSVTTATTAPSTTTFSAPPAEEPGAAETTVVVTEAAVDEEPFVLECLDGTPGPARWSDGTLAFSQWCFDQLDGNGYLKSEGEANAFECDGTVCRNPYTGGSYPDPNVSQEATDTRISTYETRSTNPEDYPAPTNTDSADGYGPGVELPPLCVRFPDTYRC